MKQFSEFNGLIGVIGSGSGELDDEIYKTAEKLGRLIAKENFALVCGGRFGVMEAVCKGAKSEQGFTIGFLPSLDKKSANSYVDLIIPTGMGEARNLILVSTADAIITIAGESGTLSEIAFAWKMGKKIVSLSTTGGWSAKLADSKIDNKRKDEIINAQTPEEAINILNNLIKP
ncbi:TIGR00725 family protein [Promethearchaeum syntrophicum]|uniref:TIGR00725 family protein n=1 Tax=Promethearchaeum syntrophicum TaxID=2594042 RepID=A0A5B9DC90_9ARCH|nr:TIGR00725 family protein [Candidatus Prometheoarchaeum syntrophicum]QEE16487.1 putative lysine decarboxylase [Candidatus Prometheoarchaeum syntrophicum]